jgi:hypothetical protein
VPPRRRVRPQLRAVLAALAGATLLVSACSSSTPGTGSPAGPETVPAGGTGAGDSIVAMLAVLPPMDPEEIGVVSVSRWHAAAEAYGVPVPADDASSDEVLDYLLALTTEDGGVAQASDLMGLLTAATASTEEEFGFGRQQIAADITAGLPPRTHQAAHGAFDPDAVVDATLAGPVGDEAEQVDVDGVPVLRWGDDLEHDLQQIHVLSQVGGAGRLGLPDDRTLLYARYDDGIAGLVQAQQGGDSLADDDHLAAVAGVLDAEGTLSAQLAYRLDGSDLPYVAVGVGVAADDGGRMVLAYSTDSESDAQAVASEVEELVTSGATVAGGRPWSDLLTDPDIGTDGSLVTATFALEGPPARWAAFLLSRENLF